MAYTTPQYPPFWEGLMTYMSQHLTSSCKVLTEGSRTGMGNSTPLIQVITAQRHAQCITYEDFGFCGN